MQLRRVFPLSTLAVFFLFANLLSAQSPTTGQIIGVAKDSSGAVIPDAKITLTSAAGVQRETTSDGTGHYAFSLVPLGPIALRQKRPDSARRQQKVWWCALRKRRLWTSV